jgi:hypothetical protein
MLHMRRTLGIVAALLFAPAANGQVLSPSDADNGRIAGAVATIDAELVADATVTLGRVNDQGVAVRRRTVRTDASGAFSFTGLPEGRYRVFASKPGYTSRQLPGPDEVTMSFSEGALVDLAVDAQALDVQVTLHRSASIAGRVIRPDGSAAPNVQVQLALPGSGRGRQVLFEAKATSQLDGRYEIRDLPPGEYLVGALNLSMPTRQPVDAAETTQEERNRAVAAARTANWSWYPGVPDQEPGSAVTLLEGVNAEGIDILLTAPQRFSVSGVVFWPVGVAPQGITIDYGDPEGQRSGIWIVSDPGGSFALSGLALGALTLLARAESEQGPLIGIATTEVMAEAFEDVRIVIDRPSLVAGRIVYEENVPQSSRATSIVAEQKLLRVSALYPVPESPVDSSGRFELTGPIGEFEFALDGLAPGLTIKRVTRNGRPLPMNRIGVAAAEVVRDIEIVVGQ